MLLTRIHMYMQYVKCAVCTMRSVCSACGVCSARCVLCAQCVLCAVCTLCSMYTVQYVHCAVCTVCSMYSLRCVQYVQCVRTSSIIAEKEKELEKNRKDGLGTFYNITHYMKIYDVLKGAYSNYKVRMCMSVFYKNASHQNLVTPFC